MDDRVQTELLSWDDTRWEIFQKARQSPLFEGPVSHFFVRAFLADGIDEVLAHMTAIEAALGLNSDYKRAAGPVYPSGVGRLV
ncbi:hypothetical protein XI09_18240 [Bradyrhizobium sp. CCBAU 11386]|nr:hypothetical protein [Bradyrhizobium sp. CCBAU 11386]